MSFENNFKFKFTVVILNLFDFMFLIKNVTTQNTDRILDTNK